MISNNVRQMYEMRKYQEIINVYAKSRSPSEEVYMFAGFVFTELGVAHEALVCFSQINIVEMQQYSGMIYRYMGICNYLLEKYETAMRAFQKGQEFKDTESSLWFDLLFPISEICRETEIINFRFVDICSEVEKKITILRGLKTYTRLNSLLGEIDVGKKIDIYIYRGRYDSNGNQLSYADNGLKVIHVCMKDAIEHEITHIIFNSLHKKMYRNRFIDEGIAMFFCEGSDWNYYMQKYGKRLRKYSILDLWRDFKVNDYNDNIEKYLVAGAFVGYLYKVYGKNKFIKFIEDESMEHAESFFNCSMVTFINEFYDAADEYMERKDTYENNNINK